MSTSLYQRLLQRGQQLAARGEASEDHLPILDRGLAASPFRQEPPTYAARLAAGAPSAQVLPYPAPAASFAPYPAIGVVPAIDGGRDGGGGLQFLNDAVSQACLCVGSCAADRPLRVRWYGRSALEENVQFWSATKFIAALQVVCQANRRSAATPIGACTVQPLDGSAPASFADLFRAMVQYAPDDRDGGRSNRIAYMLKQLLNSGEADVQTWLRNVSGNPGALLLGWYGQWESQPDYPDVVNPYRHGAQLLGPAGVLVDHRVLPISRNLVSAYDLVRMLTLLGWHQQLPEGSRLPGARWSSLATLVEGLGHDPARYIDGALEELGLLQAVSQPVILSKLGYGTVARDHPDAPALTYAAFASFHDRRTDPPRQRCFALALRIPTGPGLATGLDHDARMGAEVAEIVRRIFAEELD